MAHDRPAAFLKTNYSRHRQWIGCVATVFRPAVGIDDVVCTCCRIYATQTDSVSTILVVRERRLSRACEPVHFYWKVDQIETSYYLLHSTYANGQRYSIRFVSFCLLLLCYWDDMCVYCRLSTPPLCDKVWTHPFLFSSHSIRNIGVRARRIVSWLPVACATVFCNKCRELLPLRYIRRRITSSFAT